MTKYKPVNYKCTPGILEKFTKELDALMVKYLEKGLCALCATGKLEIAKTKITIARLDKIEEYMVEKK